MIFEKLKLMKDRKKFIQVLGMFILLGIILILSAFRIELRWPFVLFCLGIYVIVLPKKLMNPKNFVFFYYFVFYGVAPAMANRYTAMYNEFGEKVNTAYIMCAITYTIIMVTLHLGVKESESQRVYIDGKKNNFEEEQNLTLKKFDKIVLFAVFFIMLAIYISKTGGLELWLNDANAAFFSRRGSGMYYIGFTHILMIILFCENSNRIITGRDFTKRVVYICILLIASIFVGSRSTTFIMVLLLFSRFVMEIDLLNMRSLIIGGVGAGVFLYGMFVRAGSVMTNFSAVVSTCLNYFDTFENLLISLRDFPPSFGKTFFLPFNWILMKFGTYIIEPYHDMSIWLTNIYYPESWINGGTTQWPIETDMYLSFFFFGGIPLLILYFCLIAYIYSKAQKNNIWRLIYINEAMLIISHLRGGLFIFWYFWLIPMYFLLLVKYKEIKFIK